MSGRGGQHDLRHLVRGVFRERAKEPVLTLNLLRQSWPQVVGEELAAQTRPLRLSSGTLWIATVDACWAYELQFFKAELLTSVQTFLESRAVRDVRFRAEPPEAGGPAAQPAAHPAAHSAEPHPASEAGAPAAARPAAHPAPTVSYGARSAVHAAPAPRQVAEPATDYAAPAALSQAAQAIGDEALRAVFQRSLAKQRRARLRREDDEQAPSAPRKAR